MSDHYSPTQWRWRPQTRNTGTVVIGQRTEPVFLPAIADTAPAPTDPFTMQAAAKRTAINNGQRADL